MGVFNYPIEVGDREGKVYERIEAVVDAGATYTMVPGSILRRLGVAARRRIEFTVADGRTIQRDIGETQVRIDGESVSTIVVFGDDDAPPLLGAYTLEGVRLAADPVGRRLVPVKAYLL